MPLKSHKAVPRRAILVFANRLDLDLARRGLPAGAGALLSPEAIALRSSAEADVHVFTASTTFAAPGQSWHVQVGRNFAERFANAIETISALGYDEIAAIGRDCPDLRASDLALAFSELANKRLVLGPDHRGGCYLIAFRARDRHLLRGVRWLRNTDCAQLRERCRAADVFLLPVKQDLDSWADLQVAARGTDRISRLAAELLLLVSNFAQAFDHFVDLAAGRVRVRWQMPPPALIG